MINPLTTAVPLVKLEYTPEVSAPSTIPVSTFPIENDQVPRHITTAPIAKLTTGSHFEGTPADFDTWTKIPTTTIAETPPNNVISSNKLVHLILTLIPEIKELAVSLQPFFLDDGLGIM